MGDKGSKGSQKSDLCLLMEGAPGGRLQGPASTDVDFHWQYCSTAVLQLIQVFSRHKVILTISSDVLQYNNRQKINDILKNHWFRDHVDVKHAFCLCIKS